MKCPNCGYKNVKGSICPLCKDNVVLRTKAYNVSARLYNQGLELADKRDLTGAADALKKSVCFNKTNTDARNLLGLVYYEMGNVADALAQWIVSVNVNSENNPAKEYIDNYEKNIRGSEQMEDAIKLYNKALEELRGQNEDMAVIDLKKALNINPRFIEALNLLALCYLKKGKNSAALALINDVLKMDINNPKALIYYRHIFPDKSRPVSKKRAVDMPNSVYYVPDHSRNKKQKNDNPPIILTFVLGSVITLVVMGFLVIPHITSLQENQYNDIENKYNQMKIEYDTLSTEYSESMLNMQNENQELRDRIQLNADMDLQERVKTINTAKEMYEGNKVKEAALLLIDLDTTGFSSEILEQYSKLRQTVLPLAAEAFYTEGIEEQRKNNYDTAVTLLNRCINCSTEGEEIYYSSMYQLGKIAEARNNTEDALKYYKAVAENHPVEAIRSEAERFVEENS